MGYDPSSILLTDRVAIVTGAAHGIGEATAALFATFGATLAICDRDGDGLAGTAETIEKQQRPVLAEVLDVRDRAEVERFVAAAATRFGRIDTLVNNAGGTFFAPFLDVSDKGEAALVDENFGQVTNLIRKTVPVMPRGASIINVTSSEAHQAAPGFAVYAAMKAGLASLTRSLGLELAPLGIRVNAIAPDGLPTAGDDGIRDQMLTTDSVFEPVRLPPLGYFGKSEEAAAAAVFLASDLARFITGTTVHVDGGIWAGGGWRLSGRGPDE